MSQPRDHADEMRHSPLVDDRHAENLLRGRTVGAADPDRELAGVIEVLRQERTVPPQPDDELMRVFSDGISDQDAAAWAPAVPEAAAGRALGWSSRLRRAAQPVVARLAAMSLMAKLGLASSAVAAAAVGGAGAAGILPGQSGDTATHEAPAESDVGATDDAPEEADDTPDPVPRPGHSDEGADEVPSGSDVVAPLVPDVPDVTPPGWLPRLVPDGARDLQGRVDDAIGGGNDEDSGDTLGETLDDTTDELTGGVDDALDDAVDDATAEAPDTGDGADDAVDDAADAEEEPSDAVDDTSDDQVDDGDEDDANEEQDSELLP